MAGFLIKTFGCQFNELYSATIAEALRRGGHQPSDSLGEASLVIINTCAVREKAEEKAFSFLGEAAKLVGASRIVFMGCTATLDRERAVRIAGRALNVVEGTAGMEQVLSLVGTVVPLGELDCTAPRSSPRQTSNSFVDVRATVHTASFPGREVQRSLSTPAKSCIEPNGPLGVVSLSCSSWDRTSTDIGRALEG
jgi:tRNA-2-methylthio-N6-dimethylallyladenosine synthase